MTMINEDLQNSALTRVQTPVDAEGRGLYVVEIATLNSSGVPDPLPTVVIKCGDIPMVLALL